MLELNETLKQEIKTLVYFEDKESIKEYEQCLDEILNINKYESYFTEKTKRFQLQRLLLLSQLDEKEFVEFKKFFDENKKALLKCLDHKNFFGCFLEMTRTIDEYFFELLDKVDNCITKLNNDELIEISMLDKAPIERKMELVNFVQLCLSSEKQIILKKDNKHAAKKLINNMFKVVDKMINNYTSEETMAQIEILFVLYGAFNDIDKIKYFIKIMSIIKKTTNTKPLSEIFWILDNIEDSIEEHDYMNVPLKVGIVAQLLTNGIINIKTYPLKAQKLITIYKNLLKTFSKSSNNYIHFEEYNLDEISNNRIKQQVLEEIYHHNSTVLERKKKENKEHCINAIDKFDKLALDYKLDFVFTEDFKKSGIEIEKIKEYLDKLITCKGDFILSNRQSLEQVLLGSSCERIDVVFKILENFICFKDFINKNITIFTSQYDNFINNVELLKKNNIHINNPKILIINNIVIAKNIANAMLYNLPLKEEFIINDQAIYYFDQFVELGQKQFIINNLDYCNNKSKGILNRMRIMNSLGMPVVENGKILKNIENSDEFFLSEDQINMYIINDSFLVIKNEYLKVLTTDNLNFKPIKSEYFDIFDSKFKITEYEYIIDDVIISRYKVIKNFSKLKAKFPQDNEKDLLFASMIYNSYLTMEQINKIASLFYNYGTNLILK